MQLSFPSLPTSQAAAAATPFPTASNAAGNEATADTDGFASLLAGVAGGNGGGPTAAVDSPAEYAAMKLPGHPGSGPETGSGGAVVAGGATVPFVGVPSLVVGGDGRPLAAPTGVPGAEVVAPAGGDEGDLSNGVETKSPAWRRTAVDDSDAQALMMAQMPLAAPPVRVATAGDVIAGDGVEGSTEPETQAETTLFNRGKSQAGGVGATTRSTPFAGVPAAPVAALFERISARTLDPAPMRDPRNGNDPRAPGAGASATPVFAAVPSVNGTAALSPVGTPAVPVNDARVVPGALPVVDGAAQPGDAAPTATPSPPAASPSTPYGLQSATTQESTAAALSAEPAAATPKVEAAIVSQAAGEGGATREATARRVPVSRTLASSAGNDAPPAEKIAVVARGALSSTGTGEKAGMKSSLASGAKEVTGDKPELGIGAADKAATMPPGSTLDRSPSSDSVAVHAAVGSAGAKGDEAVLPPTVTLPSTAHRAVEAVLDATERFAARDQQSVNLQFTVGGTDLRVRVELRGGEVHTTFRTDSAELRAALSSEWQSVAQSPGDRSTRLAPPVFTSSDTNAGSNFEQGAQRHRHSDGEARPQAFASAPSARPGQSAAFAVAATPSLRPAAANSIHLHTLA